MHLDANKKLQIKKILAQYLGIEPEDIEESDFLKEDLHMGPVEITDFSQLLLKNGIDIDHDDWTNIQTVDDIFEYLS